MQPRRRRQPAERCTRARSPRAREPRRKAKQARHPGEVVSKQRAEGKARDSYSWCIHPARVPDTRPAEQQPTHAARKSKTPTPPTVTTRHKSTCTLVCCVWTFDEVCLRSHMPGCAVRATNAHSRLSCRAPRHPSPWTHRRPPAAGITRCVNKKAHQAWRSSTIRTTTSCSG